MPKSFEIKASSGSYPVEVGRGLVAMQLQRYENPIVLVDERLLDRLPTSCTRVISLVATEDQKSLSRIPDIILELRKLGANRSSHIIAIGGGVIQDIATFVCSIYMRGLSWSYMPTTMLGMADSCIGGKSSINVGGLKNLVGNIYPPNRVSVDTDFVTTLSADQTVGGLIEAAKICFARSYEAFCIYEQLSPGYPLSPEHAETLLVYSLDVKRWFIEVDEFDKKERLLLNYGHTFGHAVEAASGFGIAHGLAVGMGIIAANAVSRESGWLSSRGKDATQHLCRHVTNLIEAADCPPLSTISLSVVLEKFESDKKHLPEAYRIVAPCNDGGLELVSLPKTPESRDLVAVGVMEASQQLGWPIQST
jgi:3-dehydroquinate synthase